MSNFSRRQLLAASSLALASRLRALPLAQFRLGVTTDEIDEDVLTAAKFLKEFDLHWAEVRNVWGKYNTAQPLDQIREARAIFDKHALKVSVLGTGFFKVALPADTPEGRKKLDDQWKLLDGAFERAAIFGTDKLRIFGFTYQSETPDPKDYPRIYELLTEAARRAKARKMRLAVENVGGSYILTADQSAAMLKAVRESNLGLTWDPNNAAHAEPKPYPDGYRKLDHARIFNVHLRDYKRTASKAEWTAVGEGEFDNLGQIRALLKDGYKEGFTLETHFKHPQGKAMATRTSLNGLLKVIAQV
jgi:sugar phosphate isomerase/epimerase